MERTTETDAVRAKAASRVREWLIARDSFYGREAGDDDALDVEAVYGSEGTVTGHATLSLDDLRTLVDAPGPEIYDDTSEAFWEQSTPPASTDKEAGR